MSKLPGESLAWRALKGLKRNIGRTVIVDYTGATAASKPRKLKAVKLLAIASALADELKEIPEPRIGIVFPPGIGGTIANLAVAFAGKSSVNLNFTSSRDTIEQCIASAGVKTILTAGAMRQKFKEFPWTPDTRDLPALLPTKKKLIVKKLVQACVLPAPLLAKAWGIKRQAQGEATLLFSSGSTGHPKGVPLTHENLATNLEQIEAINLLPKNTRLLAVLPLFHSFGLCVTLWYPLTHPVKNISYPNPLEGATLSKIIKRERVTILVGAASLYKIYLKQMNKRDLRSLKAVVAGAEKTPKGLHEKWHKAFGSHYLEGYGLTETSPVVSVNLPHDNRIGTVGKLVKGMLARVVDVNTRKVLTTPEAKGVLEFQGGNVFDGYLNDPKTNSEVFHDGWFWSGDFGSIDKDGYLTIDGRLRRFSKIGGEMVPHGAVEDAIAAAYGWAEEGQTHAAVTGIVDESKGESLVVISERMIDVNELRVRLQRAGVPNMWIPKRVISVPALPLLPTGKLDLQKLGEIAKGDMESPGV